MALAVNSPAAAVAGSTQLRAAALSSLAVVIAGFASLPLVILLADPIAGLVTVRGTRHAADPGSAGLVLTLLLVAPAAYALFFGTLGEVLKGRVSELVHKTTMRVAAIGLVPYLVLMISAVFWTTGPQQSLMSAAGLTIPVGIAATIWASTQQH